MLLLKALRQPTTGFTLLGAHQVGTISEFSSTSDTMKLSMPTTIIYYALPKHRIADYTDKLKSFCQHVLLVYTREKPGSLALVSANENLTQNYSLAFNEVIVQGTIRTVV
ncbi:hypothetical protein CSKR_103760 [Clonorchis sinensis]|uniref:Uncharacterized protein n=1 Tax=Clonorchis sinensis TaxID=79923 RepID=A0A3R7G4L3_CLOSI|nr:hypothetical protein CSKR_103760 [Clonorchis sinensis]